MTKKESFNPNLKSVYLVKYAKPTAKMPTKIVANIDLTYLFFPTLKNLPWLKYYNYCKGLYSSASIQIIQLPSPCKKELHNDIWKIY